MTWVKCPSKAYNMPTTHDNFYVWVGFTKPGKHDYMVYQSDGNTNKMQVHKPDSFFSMPLQEDLKVKTKVYDVSSVARSFDKS